MYVIVALSFNTIHLIYRMSLSCSVQSLLLILLVYNFEVDVTHSYLFTSYPHFTPTLIE